MAITHVHPGDVATAAHQNALIDQSNRTAEGLAAGQAALSRLSTRVSDLDTRSVTGLYGAPERTSPPTCSIVATAPQPVAHATDTLVSFGETAWDTAAMFDPAAPDHGTLPVAGLYLAVLTINYQPITGATGAITAKLMRSASTPTEAPQDVAGTATFPVTTAAEGTVVALTTLLTAPAGQGLWASTWHDLTVAGEPQQAEVGISYGGTRLQLVWLAPIAP